MARLQSGARRIGGWVRFPGLPALRSPPPPDLPAVQVRAFVCRSATFPVLLRHLHQQQGLGLKLA